MNTNIDKAIDLIKDLNFNSAFIKIKQQPLKPYVNVENIDYEKALQEKNKWIEACFFEYKTNIGKDEVLKRLANSILRNEQTIIKIKNGDWFFNMELFGQLWAECLTILYFTETKCSYEFIKQFPLYHLPNDYFKECINYNSFQHVCQQNGYCQINTGKSSTLKVYRPELFVIFTKNKLKIQINEKATDTINGAYFIYSFEKGFNEGYNHIKNEYSNKLNISDIHVNDLKENYFNIEHNGFKGYNSIRNQYPLIISHEIIKRFGYYSGIVTRIDEMVKENPNLFTGFYEALPPQPINKGNERIKYTSKHYVLAYLFECNAKGESFPIGNKTELEKIGNKRIGAGKGNRFYKVFNELINKDLNVENNLIEIAGENWREAVKALTNTPELIEQYLQSKQL